MKGKKKIKLICLLTFLTVFVASSLTTNTFADTQTEDSGLKALVEEYYNGSSYVKNSIIYLNENSVKELKTYNRGWHDGSSILVRTTHYNGNELWMSRGNDEYSYYGTDSNGNLTNGTAMLALCAPSSVEVVATKSHKDWHNTSEDGMEGFYVTLKDIMETDSSLWSLNGNVYSSVDPIVIDLFKAFTAPCYLGFTDDTSNYITLVSAEIEEKDGTLELRLISSGDEGKLTNSDNIFSKAVIRKENYVTLGSYPTNKVTDATLYDNLKSQLEKTAPTAADGKWKAYTHWYDYNGNASDKKGVAKKDALYQDIVYNGEKYRAVYFNSGLAKRCDQTYSNSNQQQQTNGYNTNTLYFFDYQPLKWMIVEETESYYTLVATRVLDGVCFSHTGTAGYVNQYSSMRLFTEGSFYDWAFSDAEKELLASVTFANNKASGNKDDSADLTKSITIPSVIDVLNVFFTSQDSRKKLATDYAKLNGVQVNDAGQGYWWTRSRGASNPIRITPGGSKDENANGYFSSAGIVPQIFISK